MVFYNSIRTETGTVTNAGVFGVGALGVDRITRALTSSMDQLLNGLLI